MDEAACPVKECQLAVDVLLRACDGVLIGAHKVNLDNYSDGFPPADTTSNPDEHVDLTEDSETLTLLMQFAHKLPYPVIYSIAQEKLFGLADAAEKYMIHSAMAVANVCIRARYAEFGVQALAYATKFNYPAIADITASLTLGTELETMKASLNDDRVLFAWLQYKTTYLERITKVFNRVAIDPNANPAPRWIRTQGECPTWAYYASQVEASIPAPVLTVLSTTRGAALVTIFDKFALGCTIYNCQCHQIADEWKSAAFWLDMPSLTSFLGQSGSIDSRPFSSEVK